MLINSYPNKNELKNTTRNVEKCIQTVIMDYIRRHLFQTIAFFYCKQTIFLQILLVSTTNHFKMIIWHSALHRPSVKMSKIKPKLSGNPRTASADENLKVEDIIITCLISYALSDVFVSYMSISCRHLTFRPIKTNQKKKYTEEIHYYCM